MATLHDGILQDPMIRRLADVRRAIEAWTDQPSVRDVATVINLLHHNWLCLAFHTRRAIVVKLHCARLAQNVSRAELRLVYLNPAFLLPVDNRDSLL